LFSLALSCAQVVFCRVGVCDCVRAVGCVFQPTPLRVARCECELVSRDSVRRALGRVPRRARGRHGLRGVGFEDLREFKGGFYHERFSINSFALTRARPVLSQLVLAER